MSNSAKNILITGKVGVGKTTLVKRLLQYISVPWCGYFTERIKDGGKTLGHKMVTSDGRSKVFADRRWEELPQFGQMGVRREVFEQLGVDILRQARQSAELIVMDELGFMEANTENFHHEVFLCFDCALPVVAVIKEAAAHHWSSLLSRQHAKVFDVSLHNRHLLLPELLEHLRIVGMTVIYTL